MGDACRVPDCDGESFVRGLCVGHYRQHQRGLPLRPLRQPTTPMFALVVASIAVADADSEDDLAFDRAVRNLCAAAVRYARTQGERAECDEQARVA